MMRIIGLFVAASVAGSALAQAPFTIYRPRDGERVKERVVVQIPKNSIPEGGYVGVYLNDKFVEATVLPPVGKFYEYVLDTKARKIADGKYDLKFKLFQPVNQTAMEAGESKVTVEVANSSSIKVPSNGFALRYNFRPGTEMMYRIEQKVQYSTITEAQSRMGGRASLQEVEAEKFRMKFAVDNVYSNGDGLIRMQPATEKGKEFAMLTVAGEDEPKAYYPSDMHPLYLRVTSTGLERFGSVPIYVPIEGSPGGDVMMNLFASFPLPTLPTKRVRPGDSWQSRFQFGSLDMAKLYTQTSLTNKVPARGEFMGVEWEMGRPCAKIKHSIAQGTPVGVPNVGGKNTQGMGRDRVSVEETFWYDISTGTILKNVLDFTFDERVVVAPTGGNQGAPAGGGGQGVGVSTGGGPTRAGAGGGSAAGGLMMGPQKGAGPGGDGDEGPRGPRGGQGPRGGAPMGQGNTGGRTGGPQVGQVRFNRTRIQLSMIVER